MEIEVMSSPWKDNPVVFDDVPKRSLHEYRTDYETHLKASRKAAGKTTQSVLKLCRVVFEASVVLSEEDFKAFRKEHNELKSRSMVSQITKIGANYERLAKHAESLPASWYSLYLLAGMDDGAIQQAIEVDKTLHPLTTQRQVESIISGDDTEDAETTTDEQQDEYSFRIHVLTPTPFDVAAFQASLDAFLQQQKTTLGWLVVKAKQTA